MKLYICEKPQQARDIAPHVGAKQTGRGIITGPGVAVTWCIGHLLEQAKPEFYEPGLKQWNINLLPVMPEKWQMDVKPSTKDQYRAVSEILKSATEVVIATDADREGEVIAREVLERTRYNGPVKRLWLSAMDDASIKGALRDLRPNEKSLPMYYAGMGRARADWLCGMNITMAMTTAFSTERGRAGVHHFGRVQTVVLALVVRRERQILRFKPKTHYVLNAAFELQGVLVPVDWVIPAASCDKDGHCVDKALVDGIAKKINGKTGRLTKVVSTPEREVAPLLYSLGSLQREASARYGLKAQAVLDAAQALYEKHKATTYPRTDCEYLPVSMFGQAGAIVSALCKADGALTPIAANVDAAKPGRAFNDAKITAHHAIIPTANPAVRVGAMSQTEFLVYDLIRRRYLAQFLGAYQFQKTVIELVCESELFTKTGKTPTFKGWKRAYDGIAPSVTEKSSNSKSAAGDAVIEVAIPSVQVGDQAINRRATCVATKTTPPKRYTEGTLLGAMESIDKEIDDPRLRKIMQTKEKAGIGTDATRASTIEGLFDRQYMATEKRSILPTEKGNRLIELIERIAPELADPVLTAEWEEQLMQIEKGQLKLDQFEGELNVWLADLITKIRAQAPQRSMQAHAGQGGHGDEGEAHPCPSCGEPLRRRTGSNGAFWGCSAYPACRTTLPDADGVPGVRQPRDRAASPPQAQQGPKMTCRACQKPMRLREWQGRAFYGCTGYPECKNTQAVDPKNQV